MLYNPFEISLIPPDPHPGAKHQLETKKPQLIQIRFCTQRRQQLHDGKIAILSLLASLLDAVVHAALLGGPVFRGAPCE